MATYNRLTLFTVLVALFGALGCSAGGGASTGDGGFSNAPGEQEQAGTPLPTQFPYENFGGALSPDRIDAAQARIEAAISKVETPSNFNLSADELATAYVQGLTGHPDIRLISIDPGSYTVTLQMQDGTPLSIFTRIKPDGSYRPLTGGGIVARMRNGLQALRQRVNGAATSVLPVQQPMAVRQSGIGDPIVTKGKKVYLLNTYLPNASMPINAETTDFLEKMFKEKNYQVTKLQPNILDIKNVKDADVVWMNGHGLNLTYQLNPAAGSPQISSWIFITGHVVRPCAQETPADCASLRAGEAANEIGRGKVPYGTTTNWYATPNFYTAYWTFKSVRSLVYIDACEGYTPGPDSVQLRTALRKAGAGQIFGWEKAVYNAFAAQTVRTFFDVALGAGRNLTQETVPTRPFSVDDTYGYLDRKSLIYDNTAAAPGVPQGDAVFRTDQAPMTAIALHLVPTIQEVSIDEAKARVKVRGDFGDIEGKVTINGQPLTNVKWDLTEIFADIPPTGVTAAGPVEVTVDGKPSNIVPITLWKGKVHRYVTVVSRFGPPGLVYESDCDISFRADIHHWRSNFMAKPTRGVGPSEMVPVQQIPHASAGLCRWTVSGQGELAKHVTIAAVSQANASPIPASLAQQFVSGYLEIASGLARLSFAHPAGVDYQTFDEHGKLVEDGQYNHQFNAAFWMMAPPRIGPDFGINDNNTGLLSDDPRDQGQIEIHLQPQFLPTVDTAG
ncbi:MAG: hypothetical protein IPJ84_07010 [Bdellovibrionales bacterium]|nr:hypothetical protein [Bdellovibrionales bacterium]